MTAAARGELQVERVLGGEGGHEAQPLAERHPDVRPKFVALRSEDNLIVSGTQDEYNWLNSMAHRKQRTDHKSEPAHFPEQDRRVCCRDEILIDDASLL